MKKIVLLCCMTTLAWGQKVVPLYPKGVPGLLPAALSVQEKDTQTKPGEMMLLRDITQPTLTIYQPKEKKSEAAVVVFPGGGYRILAMDHEGYELGTWWASQGYTAVVVKYRLPLLQQDKKPSPLNLKKSLFPHSRCLHAPTLS